MPRPVGSKNRPKEIIQQEKQIKEVLNRGRGRPRKDAPTAEINKLTGEVIKHRKNKGYTASEKVLARQQKAATIAVPKTEEEISFNTRLITHIMQINELGMQADRNDLNSLRSCFVNYLKLCEQNGFNVSNLSAYAAMGMDNSAFQYFAKRDDPETREFCAFVRKTCAMFREEMVSANKLNPVIGIFWQRNYDGLRNDTEQVQAVTEQDEDYSTSGSYKEKYRNLIGE